MDEATLPHGPVIVGVDASGPTQDAIALGRRLAGIIDGQLDIITVEGAVGQALSGTASAEHAGLIVIGHGHRKHLARILHGTARQLLRASPCPVAIAPPGFADRAAPLRRIGVGFEPTPEGEAALAMGHRLANRAGGELRVIGVALPLAPLAVDDVRDQTPYLDEERRTVVAGLERALAMLPAGVPATCDARIGSAGGELVAVSDELDLLVCGSRRRHPLQALLLGSVTERLLADAGCPLVIVPRP